MVSIGDRVSRIGSDRVGIVVSEVPGGTGFQPNYVVSYQEGASETLGPQEIRVVQQRAVDVTPDVREALLTAPPGDFPDIRDPFFAERASPEEISRAEEQIQRARQAGALGGPSSRELERLRTIEAVQRRSALIAERAQRARQQTAIRALEVGGEFEEIGRGGFTSITGEVGEAVYFRPKAPKIPEFKVPDVPADFTRLSQLRRFSPKESVTPLSKEEKLRGFVSPAQKFAEELIPPVESDIPNIPGEIGRSFITLPEAAAFGPVSIGLLALDKDVQEAFGKEIGERPISTIAGIAAPAALGAAATKGFGIPLRIPGRAKAPKVSPKAVEVEASLTGLVKERPSIFIERDIATKRTPIGTETVKQLTGVIGKAGDAEFKGIALIGRKKVFVESTGTVFPKKPTGEMVSIADVKIREPSRALSLISGSKAFRETGFAEKADITPLGKQEIAPGVTAEISRFKSISPEGISAGSGAVRKLPSGAPFTYAALSKAIARRLSSKSIEAKIITQAGFDIKRFRPPKSRGFPKGPLKAGIAKDVVDPTAAIEKAIADFALMKAESRPLAKIGKPIARVAEIYPRRGAAVARVREIELPKVEEIRRTFRQETPLLSEEETPIFSRRGLLPRGKVTQEIEAPRLRAPDFLVAQRPRTEVLVGTGVTPKLGRLTGLSEIQQIESRTKIEQTPKFETEFKLKAPPIGRLRFGRSFFPRPPIIPKQRIFRMRPLSKLGGRGYREFLKPLAPPSYLIYGRRARRRKR